MKRRSHARRVDANQAEIIKALEKVGCHVSRIEKPVDLLVSYRGTWFVIEVKNPDGFDTITDDQAQFIAESKAPVYVVRSVEGAVSVVSAQQS